MAKRKRKSIVKEEPVVRLPIDGDKVFQLLSATFHVLSRSAIQMPQVRELIVTEKNRQAFNYCDGSLTQKEIAKKLRIDQGQLSKTFKRWLEAGIVFRIGERTESRLLHVFPVPKEKGSSTRTKRKKK